MKLINQDRMPHSLEDGTVLAAAGTPGSVKEVEKISDADRARLVDAGRVLVVESRREAPERPATSESKTLPGPPAAHDSKPNTKGGAK